MTDIKTMSPATGEVITKTGEVVNLVDVLGGATPVDETLYDIESYSPRTGLIIGSDGKAYDLVDLLQGGGSGGGDVSREEFEALESRVDNIDEVILDTVEPLQKQVGKTDEKVDALWKLNRGQTYDFKKEVEAGISDAPTGAKYMTLEEVQGDTRQENYHMGLAVDTGQIAGCAEAPIRELQLYGNTEQESTKGYQIFFNKGSIDEGRFVANIAADVTVLEQSNYGVKFTETLGSNTRGVYTLNYKPFEPDVPMTVSFDCAFSDKQSHRMALCDSGTGRTQNVANGHNSFVITSDRVNGLCFYFLDAREPNIEVTITNIMLERGASGHDWEPYTGGRPSPNPDYPQDVTSVEKIVICKSNNLFNPLEYYSDKNKRRSSANSGVEWHGIPVENGRYIVTCNIASNGTALVFASNSNISPSTGENGVLGSRIVDVTNGILWIGMYTYYLGGNPADKGNNTRNYETFLASNTKICVRKESEPEFEAVYETIEIVPPRAMNKVGSYADECDVENGIWRWRTVCRTLVGDNILNITNARQRNENYYGCEIRASAIVRNGETGLMLYSDLFTGVETMNSAGNNINGEQITIAGTAGSMVCGLSKSRFASLEEVQEYFNQHPFRVWCALKDETEEAIDANNLQLLRALKTTAGKTNLAIKDQLGNDVTFMFRFLRDGSEAANDVVAPTPMYPSELHAVSEINIRSTGKNLIPRLVTGEINATTGVFTNVQGSIICMDEFIQVDRTKDYIFSVDGILIGDSNLNLRFYNKDKEYIGHHTSNRILANQPINIVTDVKDTEYRFIRFRTMSKSFTDGVASKCQMEEGLTVTGYEPYTEQVKSVIPPRPLNKVAESADRMNIEKGVWEYNNHSVNIDDLLIAMNTPQEFFADTRSMDSYAKKMNVADYVGYCSNLPFSNKASVNKAFVNNAGAFRFTLVDVDSVQAAREAMAGATAVFRAGNSVEEPIDPDDLAFLRSLELLPAGHHITITDQDGSDVSYLMEYIIKLSEVVS